MLRDYGLLSLILSSSPNPTWLARKDSAVLKTSENLFQPARGGRRFLIEELIDGRWRTILRVRNTRYQELSFGSLEAAIAEHPPSVTCRIVRFVGTVGSRRAEVVVAGPGSSNWT